MCERTCRTRSELEVGLDWNWMESSKSPVARVCMLMLCVWHGGVCLDGEGLLVVRVSPL